MAITWTEDTDSRVNLGFSSIQQENTATFATSDYTTGGYSINANSFGLGRVRSMWQTGTTAPALGVVWQFDKTNKKLLAYWVGSAGQLAQVTNGTDLSAAQVTFKAEGF